MPDDTINTVDAHHVRHSNKSTLNQQMSSSSDSTTDYTTLSEGSSTIMALPLLAVPTSPSARSTNISTTPQDNGQGGVAFSLRILEDGQWQVYQTGTGPNTIDHNISLGRDDNANRPRPILGMTYNINLRNM
jgi:hypothetical protein